MAVKTLRCFCNFRLKCFLDEQETLRRFQKAVSGADRAKKEYHCACPGRESLKSRAWSILDYREKTCASTAYFVTTVIMILLSILVPAYMTDPMFQRPMTNCERLRLMKHHDMADIEIVEPYLNDCENDVLPFENVTTYDPRIRANDNDEEDSDPEENENIKNMNTKFTNKTSFLYALVVLTQMEETDKADKHQDKNGTWKVVKIPNNTLPVKALVMLETITAVFFLIDFALRIFSCPNVVPYFKSVINVTDAVSLIGILVHTFMLQFYSHKRHYDIWVVAVEYLQMLRSFRLFRVVKNVKASRVLIYSVFQNIKDLSVLGLFLVVGTCIFASILYVCEDDTTISSIPVGWYWALVTMTTVGYGDVTPKTTFGKLFACMCATSGVLLFALTVPIFTNHFIILYQYAALDNEHRVDQNAEESVETEEIDEANGNKRLDNVNYTTARPENNGNQVERFV